MLEKLDDESWTVVAVARREAGHWGGPLVHRAHFIYALLGSRIPEVAGILSTASLTPDAVKDAAGRMTSCRWTHPSGPPGFSVDAVDVLDMAREFAETLGAAMATPIHVLAAVLELDAHGPAFNEDSLLEERGLDPEALLQGVFRGFHERQTPGERSASGACEAVVERARSRRVVRLARRIVDLEAQYRSQGDYLAVVCLTGILRGLSTDESWHPDGWEKHAERLLEETVDSYSRFDDEDDEEDEEEEQE